MAAVALAVARARGAVGLGADLAKGVGRARGRAPHPGEEGRGDDKALAHGRAAQPPVGSGVSGHQLLVLGPGAAAAVKDIGGPAVIGCAVVGSGRDRQRVPSDVHPVTELVPGGAVAGGELLLLGPGGAAAGVDIDRARVASSVIIIEGPYGQGLAVQVHPPAEVVVGRAVAGGELLLQAP